MVAVIVSARHVGAVQVLRHVLLCLLLGSREWADCSGCGCSSCWSSRRPLPRRRSLLLLRAGRICIFCTLSASVGRRCWKGARMQGSPRIRAGQCGLGGGRMRRCSRGWCTLSRKDRLCMCACSRRSRLRRVLVRRACGSRRARRRGAFLWWLWDLGCIGSRLGRRSSCLVCVCTPSMRVACRLRTCRWWPLMSLGGTGTWSGAVGDLWRLRGLRQQLWWRANSLGASLG